MTELNLKNISSQTITCDKCKRDFLNLIPSFYRDWETARCFRLVHDANKRRISSVESTSGKCCSVRGY